MRVQALGSAHCPMPEKNKGRRCPFLSIFCLWRLSKEGKISNDCLSLIRSISIVKVDIPKLPDFKKMKAVKHIKFFAKNQVAIKRS